MDHTIYIIDIVQQQTGERASEVYAETTTCA